eukprot:TRINITY_DN2340_c0_g1_i2.p1 TRINITY_DN2340_c0_g1~~TRINITY_DN2340_c0_g1_i2.p1  ORF type:complete len:294 (+),score=38.84 TRINITY_DN2340_c0_g1_i2:209-1090(+)
MDWGALYLPREWKIQLIEAVKSGSPAKTKELVAKHPKLLTEHLTDESDLFKIIVMQPFQSNFAEFLGLFPSHLPDSKARALQSLEDAAKMSPHKLLVLLDTYRIFPSSLTPAKSPFEQALEQYWKLFRSEDLRLVEVYLGLWPGLYNARDRSDANSNSLHRAVLACSVPLVRRFVGLALTMNDVGVTPLHLAAGTGRIDIINLLIEQGASVDAANFSGQTPLFYAAMQQKYDAVHRLLDLGADYSLRDINGDKFYSNDTTAKELVIALKRSYRSLLRQIPALLDRVQKLEARR